MTKKKAIIVALATLGAILSLSACGADGWERGVYEYVTPDGGKVYCATTGGGGIDCNWDQYNVKNGVR
ncbi:membrane protein [Mycobacterium phage ScoobyDoobyDoo]|nr:membrane protein [Mycobacterium phage ScoobyDoobyDoo]